MTPGALHLVLASLQHVQTAPSTRQPHLVVLSVQQDNTGTPQIAPVNHVLTADVMDQEEAREILSEDFLVQMDQLEGFQLVHRQFMEAVILPTIHVPLETVVATTICQTGGHGTALDNMAVQIALPVLR